MRLVSFRIKYFRSILDSGEIDFASDVTVLAGKNEAGKTVLLKALEKFNQDDEYNFDEDDLSFDAPNDEPEVKLTFTINKDDYDSLTEDEEIPKGINRDAVVSIPFQVTKNYDNSYTFSGKDGSIVDLLLRNKLKKRTKLIKKLDGDFQKFKKFCADSGLTDYPLEKVTELTYKNIKDLKDTFLPGIDESINRLAEDKRQEATDFKNNVSEVVDEYNSLTEDWRENKQKLLDSIPNLVYFEAFDKEDALPFEISIEEAKAHKSVQRYCTISKLKLDDLLDPNTSTQRKLTVIKNISAVIEGDFKDCWKQDKIDLRVELNGDKIVFAFYQKGKKHPFKMEQRSKGLQWFLAFYLLLKAEVQQYTSIILIDEPGLFVHAQAQNDILDVLTKLASENQVVLTTHSPYLINPSRLDRIRLVIKDLDKKQNKGTKVYSFSSEATIDRVTLMPIITAIGLDVTKQLTIAADHNILLEGISDYYYIQTALAVAPKTLRSKFDEVHFIPLTGADNIPPLVSLLIGWRLDYHALLDNDSKGIEIKETLLNKLLVLEEQITMVSDEPDHQIEDLIKKSDFNEYVLEQDANYRETDLNSTVIPDSNKSPFAKRFFEKVSSGEVKLSQETKDNFKALLEKLAQKDI